MLACIGEQFEEGDEVCGVTVNIRNGKNRIEMWTKTAANEALQVRGCNSSLSRAGAGACLCLAHVQGTSTGMHALVCSKLPLVSPGSMHYCSGCWLQALAGVGQQRAALRSPH